MTTVPSQEVTAALLGKHPQEPPGLDVDYEKPASLPSNLRVSEGEVMKAIKKFHLGSAAGGSGLRPNHIYELSKVQDFGHGSTFISAMTRFVNLFLSGKRPPQLAPWLCGAPLTALQKRNGGIRPIAVGETLRRLISSCAMNHISKTAANWFHPLQFGIATINGTEAVVHAVRKVTQHHGSNSEYGLLSVDLTNAFNLVSRNAFLNGVKHHFPSLLTWTSYCYGGEASFLRSGEDSIRSVRGVQQEDPLGPLLFAIALQPIAADLRKRLQESESSTDSSPLLTMWYLDDGYIIAKHHQLREAVAHLLSNDVKASGLHLNFSKCHVWWPKEPTESAKAAYPTELSQEYTEGTSILNAPLGTHGYMEENIVTKVKALEPLFERFHFF